MIRAPVGAGAVAAIGCALLALRPLLLPGGAVAPWATAGLFAGLLVVGTCWPPFRCADPASQHRFRTPIRGKAAVLAVGLGAFAAGRLLAGEIGLRVGPRLVLLLVLAAVAEEAFFRRLVYRALLGGGEAAAVVGSASLFALVHVTVYGWWVLPLDLAAGLVLSWQRWASGTWTVPATAHVGANLLVMV